MAAERCETKAFGVEAGLPPYRLRQARYYELGKDCANWADELFKGNNRRLKFLDVGMHTGVLRRYTEIHPSSKHIDYEGVDVFPHGKDRVYKRAEWILHQHNLEEGMPGVEANNYDVVVCEQVLEHLSKPHVALSEMYRVLKPGGRLVVGVPIFPPGLDLIRKYVVPATDRFFAVKKVRGHVQGWSRGSFLRFVRRTCSDLVVEKTRGFRIVSGGILRPLEYHRWWWQMNRKIGSVASALCVEIQVIAHKPQSQTAGKRLNSAA